MTLRTERFLLRPIEPRDAAEIIAMDSDPEVMRYLGQPGGTIAATLSWIEELREYSEGTGFWTAERDGEFLGWFHLRPGHEEPFEMELGYRLKRAAWDQGYATEGSRALLAHAWGRLAAPSVTATTDVENIRSRRVMEKIGMVHAGDFLYDGRLPSVRYRVLRPQD